MPAERTLDPSEPVMVAWNTYLTTFEYQNSFNWAAQEQHRKGSMWAAFLSGYQAALSTPPAQGHGEPVQMLVDADWLKRKVETDPDLPVEAGHGAGAGWKLVPRELSAEMVDAAVKAAPVLDRSAAREVGRAMYDAAPAQPA